VLIISLDGLRPDALSSLRAPNMTQLAAHGASASHAQTTTPSTLPAHASMLSGYKPWGHGIIWNDYIPLFGSIRSSTVFSIAHEHGLRSVMLVAKEKLVHIAATGTVDEFHYISGGDDVIVKAGIENIEEGFGVLFIHLRALDSTGHRYGWMSAEYLAATNRTDQHVGDLLQAIEAAELEGSTLVILTSDHGGSGTSHGSRSEEDMTIPWIVSGPGVMTGIELGDDISTMDTAATALWSLRLPLPDDLDGRPIMEMFAASAIEACGLAPISLNPSDNLN
jgi:arylsulfatase A-like enzyme